jgi:hypothetical protein
MKKLLFLIVLAAFALNINAQVANYTFSTVTSTYNEITGGTVLGTGTIDDNNYNANNIGFSFTYNGTAYTQFSANANGFIAMGATVSSSYSAISGGTSNNVISPANEDLQGNTGGELSYLLSGTTPNQVLTIQWKNFRHYGASSEIYNFQIKLYETTNVIEFVYGSYTKNSTARTQQVGLRGSSNSDYNNRTTTINWSASTAGISNTATMTLSSTVLPVSGTIFHWAPPIVYQYDAGISTINAPVSPVSSGTANITVTVKNFASILLNSASIAWTVNGVLQAPYSYTNVSGLAQNATDGPVTIGSFNFTTPGFYTIKAWTENPNSNADQNNANDTTAKTVFVQGFASIPFIEDFDGTWINKFNTREVPSLFWTNTPATGNQSWRRNDDGTSAAWSGTSGAYIPTGANGTANSARFHTYNASSGTVGTMDVYLDLTTVGTKILKFWYINPSGSDSLDVYISDNGGTSFTHLQKFIVSTAWTEKSIILGTSTAANTIIRFKATSDYGNDDLGIDRVRVNLLQANDMAAVSWVSPVSGCGLTSTEPVTIKFTNVGTAAQTNIPLFYSIDGGTTIVGPESYTATTVNPGDTVSFTFAQTANMATPGKYNCGFVTGLLTDGDHTNDTLIINITNTGTISSFPFNENFETGTSNYLLLANGADAGIKVLNNIGTQNSYGLHMEGKTSTGWPSSYGTAALAFAGVSHISSAATCSVNSTGLTVLKMKFDLKQTYSYSATYNWFMVLANGVDTLTDSNGNKFFKPVTSNSDAYATRSFNLASYAGTNFTLTFKAVCKYNDANGSGGIGDNVFIDNLQLFVPADTDAGVTAIIKPLNSLCGLASDSVISIVTNFGNHTLTTIPVIAQINTPSGPINMNATYTGSLASGASDTLFLGLINTTTPGNYVLKAFTDIPGDTVFTNDTLLTTIVTKTALTVPHMENFESITPLANWNTNFLSGNGHGNTSYVMYRNLYSSATTATAIFKEKIGAVTANTYFSFDYRITNYSGGLATTLVKDSIFALISDDCGDNFYVAALIDSLHHTPATTMKHIQIPIGAFAGSNVIPAFFAKWNAGDYYLDIDNVAISDSPVINLGSDINLCSGLDTTLNAGDSASGYTYTYAWSTLLHPATFATTQTISVDTAATYIVTVNNGFGVTDADTVVVNVVPNPIVSLGSDVTACLTNIIDAGTGYSSYSWSTAETTQTITVNATGNYSVDVTNSNGCHAVDTVHVTILSLPTVNAGANQSMCYLDTLHLTTAVAANYDSLLWTSSGVGHFNDSTLLHPYYIASSADTTNGSVNLTLTAYSSCDTVSSVMTYNLFTSITAFAGNDVTICHGASVQLAATGGITYLWSPSLGLSDTTIANPIASPNQTTTYTVLVSGSCGTAIDNITVNVHNATPVSLGPDTSLCSSHFTIDAGTGYDTYLWSTNDTTQIITVTATDEYYVTVTDSIGCSAIDSIHIVYLPIPVAQIYGDSLICDGSSAYLSTDAGLASYLWNGTTSGNEHYTVSTSGDYWVDVTAQNGCTATSDTFHVDIFNLPDVNLGPDVTIHLTEYIILDAGHGYDHYSWSVGANTQTLTVYASNLGIGDHIVWVQAWSDGGCISSDSIIVHVINNLGIDDITDGQNCSLYPNPANDYTVVNVPASWSNTDLKVNLTDVAGRSIRNMSISNVSSFKFDLAGIAPGIYQIIISNGAEQSNLKLIVQ